MSEPIHFAINRHRKTVCVLTGFSCFEHVRAAFYVGILMPDGHSANGIGRRPSLKNLQSTAARVGYKLIS